MTGTYIELEQVVRCSNLVDTESGGLVHEQPWPRYFWGAPPYVLRNICSVSTEKWRSDLSSFKSFPRYFPRKDLEKDEKSLDV
jgi:hypothetical protein